MIIRVVECKGGKDRDLPVQPYCKPCASTGVGASRGSTSCPPVLDSTTCISRVPTNPCGLHVAMPRVGLASANASPRIRCATVGRLTCWRPAPTYAPSKSCSGTVIWKPPPSTCICRSGTCRQLTIRWTVSLYPAPRTSAAALNGKTKNDSAHLRGGRHSSRAGRSLSGSVSIQLWLSAAQSVSGHSALPHRSLGGHRDACPSCGHQAISYNSCRNRHCPKCQTQARERWLAARERELLTTSYFHVVFTVPHELNVLALENPRLFYDLLFAASAQTLLEIAIDRKHLGADIGLIGLLHTWGQNLLLHPHIHCAIPAGGLSPDHRKWVRPRYPFFLPVKVLSRVFRGRFLAGLKRLHHRHQLCCAGPTVALADPQQFAKLMRRLHRHDWVVYAKPAFGGPLQVLRYLGRYTHRVAISNHRLLAFDQELVTFRWKDYAHGGKQGRMTLGATEFLRRFFVHVLPRGFVRIRHFGFLANRFRASRLALSRQLLSSNSTPPAEGVICATSSQTSSLWHCPRCGAAMIVIQRFTAAELSTCCYFDSS